MLKIYEVGGAVRDHVLGVVPRDHDYVVTGATEADMLNAGFTKVGADFPVFLSPETKEEYALARVERKTGSGYLGFSTQFSPDVTIEDDLGRRDLTINAMARTASGDLIDPFNGQRDIEDRILRHTTEAFREDPVRVLRLARFLARFGHDWVVASKTETLVRQMIEAGELAHLTPERVWKEIEKGLMEPYPDLMIAFMIRHSVFSLAPFKDYRPVSRARVLREAVVSTDDVSVRFSLLFPQLWAKQDKVSLPSHVRDLAHLSWVARSVPYRSLPALGRLNLLKELDATRQKTRFAKVIQVLTLANCPHVDHLARDALVLDSIDVQAVIQGIPAGPQKGTLIGQALHEEQLRRLAC